MIASRVALCFSSSHYLCQCVLVIGFLFPECLQSEDVIAAAEIRRRLSDAFEVVCFVPIDSFV